MTKSIGGIKIINYTRFDIEEKRRRHSNSRSFHLAWHGKSKTPTSKIVDIAVPISVSVLLFVVGYCCITRRARKKYNQAAADAPSATSNFSDDHKLGEGGFGQVYKDMTGVLLQVYKVPTFMHAKSE
ncbi:hypothetical protein DVH24_017051 [Malus domestica]|uniref:Protein kinase domain-containing protein n=1 Tax=Malus domestica TaxID=3750 RepID=A0A498IR90_MALDO|nr:hypothetical protein DVH24_017051 [Malus domestica]